MTEKKIKKLSLIKRLLFVTLIAYIVLFIVMNISYLSLDNMKRFYSSAKAALSQVYSSIDDEFVFDQDANPIWLQYKDGYAVYDGSYLSVYSKDNVCFSKEKLGLSNPVFRSSEKYIICYDRGTVSLNVFDSFKNVFRYSGTETVINAAVNDDGRIAVITEKNGFKGSLTVYDKSFEPQFVWNAADSYPIDVFFPNKNTVSVVTVSQNAEKIITSVVTFYYQSGKEKTNVSYEESYPLAVCSKSDGSVEIITETGLKSFRSGGVNEIFTFSAFTPDMFYQGENITAFTHHSDTRSDLCYVTAIDSYGNILFTVPYNGVRDISTYGDSVFVLGTGEFYILDKTGAEVAKVLTDKIYSSVFFGKNHVFISSSSEAKIYKLSSIIK